MKQITAEEFTDFVTRDPAWASKLTEPVEITTYANLKGSNITHLSPLLTFSGKDKDGDTASFKNCPNLKIATGKFVGWVTFSKSRIEKIQDLEVTQPNTYGWAADFYECQNLKVATGKFEGSVNFARSGIERIQDLEVTQPNKEGWAAAFWGCQNLKRVTGEYPGKMNFEDSPNISKAPAWILDPKKAINVPDKVLKRIQKLLQKPPEIDIPI